MGRRGFVRQPPGGDGRECPLCLLCAVCDVEQGFGVDKERRFDLIVLADILEHVRNPEEMLLRARQHLRPGGRILASTGNVAHLYVRLALLLGRSPIPSGASWTGPTSGCSPGTPSVACSSCAHSASGGEWW
jgi:hypothetical protein